MACPRDITATINNSIDSYIGYNSVISNNMTMTDNNRPQYNSNLSKNDLFLKIRKCKEEKNNKYPRFTPVILSLSMNTSVKGSYSVVYIRGINFLPPCIGTTYVNFGTYTQLPIIYFSSNFLSFTIPLNAVPRNYSVVVVNVYNNNFSQQVKTSYAANLNYSNAINYTIT
jgi:hypothetical protein